jgi:hypothetical protein
MNQKFSEEWALLGGLDPSTVATGTLCTDFVPVGEHDRYVLLIKVGATDGLVDLKLQMCTAKSITGAGSAAGGGGAVADLGTVYALTQIGAGGDGRTAIVEVPASVLRKAIDAAPTYLYLGALITVTGGTGALVSVAILGRSLTPPAYTRDAQENTATVGGLAEVKGS